MKHYKDSKGQIRAIEPNQKFLVEDDWIELSSEALIKELSDRDKSKTNAGSVRRRRDTLLSQTDWYVIKSVETGVPVPANVTAYRQALRDIPEQTGFPGEVIWPELN